jgi:autotransporter-associated beta strand protein
VVNNGTLMFHRSDALTFRNTISGSGRLTKLGAGTLTLTGTNTYSGITTILPGTLQIGDGGTTGTLGPANITNAGTLAFNRSDTYTLGSGNLVTGTGAVTLANTGPVAAATDGQFNTTGALNFGATVGSTTVSALDLTSGSSTFGNLVAQTNSASNNVITLGSGKTLALTGSTVLNAISVGTNTAGGVAKLQVTGATAGVGTLTITDATRNMVVANTDGGTTAGASAQLDLSGLAAFNATVANLYVGRPTTAAGAATGGRPNDSLTLAGTNNITVSGTIVVGAQSSIGFQGSGSFRLGTTNTINANTIVVGSGRVPGTFEFNSGLTSPTLTLRGAAGGTSRTSITLGDQLNSTGVGTGAGGSNTTTGTMNFTAGTVDALIETLTVGNGAGTASNNRGKGNGVFTFGTGSSVDINTLRIGQAADTTSVSTNQPQTGAGTGTFTMNGGALLVNTAFTIANDVDTTNTTNGVQNVTGIFNQSDGTTTIGTPGSTVNVVMGNHLNAANSGLATATMNLTGGTLNVFGDIREGNLGAGTITSSLSLDGGTLDMKGNDIGVSGATIDTLTFASGELKDVASINGTGGLTKTTAGTLLLSGTVSYAGDTTVSEGILTLSGAASPANANPANDASTVTIADTSFLNLTYTGTDKVAKLVIGATELAAGFVYGKSGSALPVIGIPQITGDGTLTVGPSFSSWINGTFANGQVPSDKRGPNDDPDNDGIRNLVEYAIAGQDPTVSNASAGTFTGTSLSFTKREPLPADITYAIVESTDLGIADTWAEVTGTPPTYVNNATTISYTFTPGTPAKNFFRLNVTQNP